MTIHFGLIVTDASPLITLAAAEALDLLTMPKIPVYIPDMVYHEVMRQSAKLGAEPIIEWTRANRKLVSIEPTLIYAEYLQLLTVNPKTSPRNRGERAAVEVLNDAIARDLSLEAILVFEDSDVMRRKIGELLPERVSRLSTGVSLRELEACGRIQSADQILDQAAARGRNVGHQKAGSASPEVSAALRAQLAANPGGQGRA